MKAAQWKERVASIGCILCSHLGHEDTPATLHHIREGQGKGQRAPDWLVIPLCFYHHQGPEGFHTLGSRFYSRFKLDELDLLALTIEKAIR